jgi:hypothetical protein
MAVKRSDFIVRLYSQIDFERKNKHVILKTRNKYSQKVHEIVLYKNMNKRWLLTTLSSETFCLLTKQRQFPNFRWDTFL